MHIRNGINRLFVTAAIVFGHLACSTQAWSAPIRVFVEGSGSGFDTTRQFDTSGTLTGYFEFDPDSPTNFISFDRTNYFPAITAVDLQLSGMELQPASVPTGAFLVDNNLAFYDAIQVTIPLQDMLGLVSMSIRFNLDDMNGTTFASTALPQTLHISDFTRGATFDLRGRLPSTAGNLRDLSVSGNLTRFDTVAIPLPPAVLLMVSSIGLLAAFGMDRKAARTAV